MSKPLYDWSTTRNPGDFVLEGNGEVQRTEAGELLIRTFHLGPMRKASNVWFRNLVLPTSFRLSWRYRSESVAGNTMVIFNATPILLKNLFEDSRPDARYSDLSGWRKLVAYTCGFHRGAYNNPCVLRKIGGNVPEDWGMLTWGGDASNVADQITRFNTTQEPLTPADKGKWHEFVLERQANHMRFLVNGTLVQDVADTGQYPYHTTPLSGGHLGFRNFGGPADDFYAQIRLETIEQ